MERNAHASIEHLQRLPFVDVCTLNAKHSDIPNTFIKGLPNSGYICNTKTQKWHN